MIEKEVNEYFETLELYEFHELIKTEARRRLRDGECDNLDMDGTGNYPAREQHIAIINLGWV